MSVLLRDITWSFKIIPLNTHTKSEQFVDQILTAIS